MIFCLGLLHLPHGDQSRDLCCWKGASWEKDISHGLRNLHSLDALGTDSGVAWFRWQSWVADVFCWAGLYMDCHRPDVHTQAPSSETKAFSQLFHVVGS